MNFTLRIMCKIWKFGFSDSKNPSNTEFGRFWKTFLRDCGKRCTWCFLTSRWPGSEFTIIFELNDSTNKRVVTVILDSNFLNIYQNRCSFRMHFLVPPFIFVIVYDANRSQNFLTNSSGRPAFLNFSSCMGCKIW